MRHQYQARNNPWATFFNGNNSPISKRPLFSGDLENSMLSVSRRPGEARAPLIVFYYFEFLGLLGNKLTKTLKLVLLFDGTGKALYCGLLRISAAAIQVLSRLLHSPAKVTA